MQQTAGPSRLIYKVFWQIGVNIQKSYQEVAQNWEKYNFFLCSTQTCEADRTLEGSTHALEAVLNQVALKFRRRVKRLTT